MVKTPTTRHSTVERKPLTIEIEPVSQPGDEAPVEEEAMTASAEAAENEKAAPAAADDGKAQGGAAARNNGKAATGVRQGLVGGFLGGVIALGVAGLGQYAGLVPAPGGAETASLRSEIAALRGQLTGSGDETALQAVQEGLSASGARMDDLALRLDKAEAGIGSLREAIPPAADDTALVALEERVEALQRQFASLQDSAAQNNAIAGGGATPASDETLQALDGRIASLEGEAEATAHHVETMGRLVTELEQRTAGIESRLAGQSDQSRAALAIAAAGLKAAIERGGSFSSELETLAAVRPELPELEQLRGFAENGVASQAELVGAMKDAADAMIDATQKLDENAGMLDRLAASAKSLVRVRPTGAVKGEGVPETVARMEAAVEEGNLAAALAEYDSLPEASRAAAAGFAGSLRLRLEVEELAGKVLASALQPA